MAAVLNGVELKLKGKCHQKRKPKLGREGKKSLLAKTIMKNSHVSELGSKGFGLSEGVPCGEMCPFVFFFPMGVGGGSHGQQDQTLAGHPAICQGS